MCFRILKKIILIVRIIRIIVRAKKLRINQHWHKWYSNAKENKCRRTKKALRFLFTSKPKNKIIETRNCKITIQNRRRYLEILKIIQGLFSGEVRYTACRPYNSTLKAITSCGAFAALRRPKFCCVSKDCKEEFLLKCCSFGLHSRLLKTSYLHSCSATT